MTDATRKHYHSQLWPAACQAQGWRPKDEAFRRDLVMKCMELVRGPMVTTSDARFGDAEITALFCYLHHLADPDCINKSMRWDQCRADYQAFHIAKQADYWQRKSGAGYRSTKWTRNRFAGRKRALGTPLDEPLSEKEARDRRMTFRNQARAKEDEQRREAMPAARRNIEPVPEPEDEYIPF